MTTMNWQQHHILLTGATGGLGQALCRQLTDKGARVTLIGRHVGRLQELASALQQPFLHADVLADDFIERVNAYVKAQNDYPVTALINNAAVTYVGQFEMAPRGDIARVVQTNLIRPMELCHLVLPQLPAHGWVMNIGSVFGAIGFPGQALYNASKFGLRGFTQGLQRERDGNQARVFYCAPRAIKTPLNDGLMESMNRVLKTSQDSPELVAQQVIKQLEKGTLNTTIGWPEKLFVRLNGLIPSLIDSSMKKPRQLLKQLTKGALS